MYINLQFPTGLLQDSQSLYKILVQSHKFLIKILINTVKCDFKAVFSKVN